MKSKLKTLRIQNKNCGTATRQTKIHKSGELSPENSLEFRFDVDLMAPPDSNPGAELTAGWPSDADPIKVTCSTLTLCGHIR